MNLIRRYTFEAAHQLHGLPDEHPCSRLHGHHYEFEVMVNGELDDRGMVIEYGELDALIAPVLDRYDHRDINEFLEQPTVEHISTDIWLMLKDVNHDGTEVVRLRVWETARSSVMLP